MPQCSVFNGHVGGREPSSVRSAAFKQTVIDVYIHLALDLLGFSRVSTNPEIFL